MSNGRLVPAEGGSFTGYVSTLAVNIKVALQINPQYDARNENSPKFEVFARAGDGRVVRIGAAWEKTARKNGKKFLSIALDDPSMPAPLNVTAFPTDGVNDGSFDVVWRRPRQPSGDVSAPRGADDGDDLPF